MLNDEMKKIMEDSRPDGWVLEPRAKKLLSLAGLKTPNHAWAKDEAQALKKAAKIGYPVVAKVVSPQVVHKSDVGGVAVGIEDDEQLKEACARFAAMDGYQGVLVEEMASGVEVIIGSKNDEQFGQVVLLGIGGTAVELYKDTVLRLAPIEPSQANQMIHELKGSRLLTGFRGSEAVNLEALAQTVSSFSKLVDELGEEVESIDLNPVMCTPDQCLIADARIMLAGQE